MFVRNLLQAGDYVVTVPVGILITLQYNERGMIQKVYQNHDVAARVELSNDILASLLKHKQIPSKIMIQGGTTWIEGVLYSETLPRVSGDLPDCIASTLLDNYLSNSAQFKFYAGNVESLAQKFTGSLSVKQWLATNNFEALPGYLIAGEMTEDEFEAMIARDFPFMFPLVANYIVFRGTDVLHMCTGLSQCIIQSVVRNVSTSGVITAAVTTTDNITYNISYSDIVKFHIVPGACIISASDGRILYTTSNEDPKDVIGNTITCSCCGRKLVIPATNRSTFKCSDPQCNSVLYPRVKQLLEAFNLEPMSYDQYKEISDKIGTIFSIPDIFDIEPYASAEVSITLSQALRGVIPKSILPGMQQISQLSDMCNNSMDTIIYYVKNVDVMRTDLDLDIHTFARLFKWLLNPENASDVIELLSLSNLTIISNNCEFEGAPIFRDKTILLTGTFQHGSHSDVAAILSNYAAHVVTTWSDDINCILLGDIDENVVGKFIRDGKENGIPIFRESMFFAKYDIDSDMAENL